MGKRVLALLILGLAFSGVSCSQGAGDRIAAKLYREVPVPVDAKKAYEGRAMGLSKKSWQGIFTTGKSMKQVADWYDSELEELGWQYKKAPDRPEVAGYTIFNIRDGERQVKIVVINEAEKDGANIQINGGRADEPL